MIHEYFESCGITEAFERLKNTLIEAFEAVAESAEKTIEKIKHIISDLTESLLKLDEDLKIINTNQAVKSHKPKYAKGESYYKNQRKPIKRKIHRIQKRG